GSMSLGPRSGARRPSAARNLLLAACLVTGLRIVSCPEPARAQGGAETQNAATTGADSLNAKAAGADSLNAKAAGADSLNATSAGADSLNAPSGGSTPGIPAQSAPSAADSTAIMKAMQASDRAVAQALGKGPYADPDRFELGIGVPRDFFDWLGT